MTASGAQTNRILIVDDEPDLVELITYNFTREGFKVSSAADAEEALDRIKKGGISLVILDLMLPGLQGMELCRIIRKNPLTAQMPIVMLTAKSEVAEKIEGIESGADDYVTKPFSPRELIARVHAVLRRSSSGAAQERILMLGNLRIDRERYTVNKGGAPVNLSTTEFQILLYLMERRGKVFSRDQLLDAIWQDGTFVEPRTVDVHIRRLRSRIEDDPSRPTLVKTRRGVGYYIDGE
jgi:phosphate regulon transcriptional regulator PhoB